MYLCMYCIDCVSNINTHTPFIFFVCMSIDSAVRECEELGGIARCRTMESAGESPTLPYRPIHTYTTINWLSVYFILPKPVLSSSFIRMYVCIYVRMYVCIYKDMCI